MPEIVRCSRKVSRGRASANSTQKPAGTSRAREHDEEGRSRHRCRVPVHALRRHLHQRGVPWNGADSWSLGGAGICSKFLAGREMARRYAFLDRPS